MSYILLSGVCLAGFIALYIVQRRTPGTRIVGIANGICGGIGTLLYPTVIWLLRYLLHGESDPDFVSWAWDAFALYLRFAWIVTSALLCLTILACVFSPCTKAHRGSTRLRLLVSLFSSAALLLTGPFYAFMTETDRLPLSALVLTVSFASALSMRWHAFAEWIRQRCIAKKGTPPTAEKAQDL